VEAERTVSAPDRDFGPVAKFYPARIPYLPRFFPALAEMIGLSKETFALDLACGTGELAVGFAPYCGSVLGIDRSSEMISMRRSVPANVRFMQAELNSGSLQIPEPADFVTIGRALHYLKPEALLPFLRSSTKPSASLLICNSDIHGTTPWAGEYNRLIATYVERINHPDFYGRRFFADSGWLPVRRPRATGTIRCRVNHVLAHTFSFPRYADVLLKHEREFSERLRDLLKPYCVSGDRVDVNVLSDGIEYCRLPQRG
jgi:SAM-dependent methyltransferase